MATVFLSPIGNGWQFFDDNGDPVASGAVNTYAAGTTTPTATYTDSTGNTLNANPIPLNAAGRIATQVWLPQGIAVRFVPVSSVSTAVGVAQDNLYGINDPTTLNGIGYTGATVSGAIIMNLAPINEAQGANIPVAAAINLTNATGNYLSLTGSGTITSLQLLQGAERVFVVNSVSCAFQNSATLPMLGGTSITPAVGDIVGFRGEAPPVVRNVLYQSASGTGTIVTVSANKVLAGPTLSSAAAAQATYRYLSGFDGASWVLLSSGAASASATFEFTNQIDSTYDQYAVLLSNVVPATNSTNLLLQVGATAGTTYITVSYHQTSFNYNDAAASSPAGSAVATSIQITSNQLNNTGQGFGGYLFFEQPAIGTHFKQFNSMGTYITATSNLTQFIAGGAHQQNGEAIDKIRFLFSSGNIATGNFALYGIRKG